MLRFCSSLKTLVILLHSLTFGSDSDGSDNGPSSLSSDEVTTFSTVTDAILPFIPATVASVTLSFPENHHCRGTSPLMKKWLETGNLSGVEEKLIALAGVKEINIVLSCGGTRLQEDLQQRMVSAFPALNQTGKLLFPVDHQVECQVRPIELDDDMDY